MTACSPRTAPIPTCSRIRCRPNASPRWRNWRVQAPIGTRRTIRPCKCATTWCAPRSRPSWSGRTPSTGAIRCRTTSLPARYAHAITTYLHGDLRTALAQIDGLIQVQPNNPYFYELRGQALLEGGKPAEAIAPLRKAVQLSNNAPLIEMLLGQALVATDNKAYTEEAIAILRAAVARETEAPLGYTQLAMAYGRKGDYAEADLASAQAAYLRGDNKTARELASRAKTRFADRHARMGQGRRHRHRKAAARPEELELTTEITRSETALTTAGLSRNRRTLAQEDLPMPSFRLLAPALFALALCGAPPAASAQSFSDTQRGDIETIVKNYLIAHPEVLEEAMAELSKRQAAAEADKHEASVAKNADDDLQLAARRHARQQGRRRHLRRVLRLQLRLLQTRDGRHAGSDEDRSEAEGRAEGISGAEPGLGRGRPGRGRRAHAGSHRQEISRLPPEAARRPRPGRQGARDGGGQGRRPRHGEARKGHGEPGSAAPPSRKTSSSPRTWA